MKTELCVFAGQVKVMSSFGSCLVCLSQQKMTLLLHSLDKDFFRNWNLGLYVMCYFETIQFFCMDYNSTAHYRATLGKIGQSLLHISIFVNK